MAGAGSLDTNTDGTKYLSPNVVNQLLAINASGPNLYLPGLATSSLLEFYDDVVYWEIAKNTNRFFVTFERGMYAPANNKQESIATMEIDFPNVNANYTDSSFEIWGASQSKGGTRNQVSPMAFIQSESYSIGVEFKHPGYNGYIPVTQLKGTRGFQSEITSSITKSLTCSYEMYYNAFLGTQTASRSYNVSYFYPFSSHQLSVLRSSPTLIIDLNKDNELPSYTSEKGFVAIPFQTHQKIKDNLEFYLEKAGIIEKTVRRKAPKKGK